MLYLHGIPYATGTQQTLTLSSSFFPQELPERHLPPLMLKS